MTIIEREMEKRQRLIDEKHDKENKVKELEIEMEKLLKEIDEVDEPTLQLEIDELRTYLPTPKVEEPVEEIPQPEVVNVQPIYNGAANY